MRETQRLSYDRMNDDQMQLAIQALQDVKETYGYRLIMADVANLQQEAMGHIVSAQEPHQLYRAQGAISAAENLTESADAMIEHMQDILTERREEKAATQHAKRYGPNQVK